MSTHMYTCLVLLQESPQWQILQNMPATTCDLCWALPPLTCLWRSTRRPPFTSSAQRAWGCSLRGEIQDVRDSGKRVTCSQNGGGWRHTTQSSQVGKAACSEPWSHPYTQLPHRQAAISSCHLWLWISISVRWQRCSEFGLRVWWQLGVVVTVSESWNRYGKTVFAQRQESPEEWESYWELLGDQGYWETTRTSPQLRIHF